jgi:hypothetical protein
MRTVSFIVAELLDALTTVIALRMGFTELNPISWGWLIPLKVVVVIAVALVLRKTTRKIYWAVPVVAWLVVVWNVINIGLYYI